MVGIVIIAHSHELAVGVQAMAEQMRIDSDVSSTAAGEMKDGLLGTNFDRIEPQDLGRYLIIT